MTEYPILSDSELLYELNKLKALCDSFDLNKYQTGGLVLTA